MFSQNNQTDKITAKKELKNKIIVKVIQTIYKIMFLQIHIITSQSVSIIFRYHK